MDYLICWRALLLLLSALPLAHASSNHHKSHYFVQMSSTDRIEEVDRIVASARIGLRGVGQLWSGCHMQSLVMTSRPAGLVMASLRSETIVCRADATYGAAGVALIGHFGAAAANPLAGSRLLKSVALRYDEKKSDEDREFAAPTNRQAGGSQFRVRRHCCRGSH